MTTTTAIPAAVSNAEPQTGRPAVDVPDGVLDDAVRALQGRFRRINPHWYLEGEL